MLLPDVKIYAIEAFVIEGVEKRGEHWHYFADSTSGDVPIFWGIVKIMRKTTHIVQVWVRNEPMHTYEDINFFSMAKDFSNDAMLWQFNCSTSEMNTLQYISYGSKGEVLQSSHNKTPFESIVPGSLGETLYNLVCKKKK